MTAIELIRDELSIVSRPRMTRMLRMTALVALVVTFSMAKRVPDAAVSAYMIFLVMQRDAATTVGFGIGAVLGATIAIALAFVCFSLSMSEPAVRVPLMVVLAFGGAYALRATPAGGVGLLLGFLMFYVQTFADWVSSPEALSRALLWAWVFIVYPIGVLVVADLAFGSRAVEIYRSGIAERLQAAAADLRGDPGARVRLARYVRLGAGDIAAYVSSGPDAPIRASLLRQTELLGVLVRDLPDDIRRVSSMQPALQRAAAACEGARDRVLGHRVVDRDFALLDDERRGLDAIAPAARAVVLPLVTCVQTIALGARELTRVPAGRAPLVHLPKSPPHADRAEGVRFALKVTLAAIAAYLIYTGLDWYGIHTATITCFFVAQASVGASLHKLTLRLAGAVIGGSLGMLAILFVLPGLDSIGGLVVLVAAVTLLAAWFATASERISYAGWQIAISFYLTVLQGYGPTTELHVARDRVIGILLGNILLSVVFTSLWPVRAEPAQRRALSRVASTLATLLRTPPGERDAVDRAEAELYAQITEAREYEALVRFERRGTRPLPAMVQGLVIPIHAIARTAVPASASPAARAALASANADASAWLDAYAASIISGTPAPQPSPDAAAVVLAPIATHEAETAATRAHVRQHLAWLELVRAQGVALVDRGPA